MLKTKPQSDFALRSSSSYRCKIQALGSIPLCYLAAALQPPHSILFFQVHMPGWKHVVQQPCKLLSSVHAKTSLKTFPNRPSAVCPAVGEIWLTPYLLGSTGGPPAMGNTGCHSGSLFLNNHTRKVREEAGIRRLRLLCRDRGKRV